MTLRDRVAVVTGGGSGIGRATARLFADEGAAVVTADRDRGTGFAAAEEMRRLGLNGEFRYADVSRASDVGALVEAVAAPTPVTVPMEAPLRRRLRVEAGTTRTIVELITDEGLVGLRSAGSGRLL